MARNFVAASTQYLTGLAPVTAYPFTMAAWFKLTSTGQRSIMCEDDTSGGTIKAELRTDGSSHVQAHCYDGATDSSATTSTTIGTATWAHAAGVFNSTTDRRAYLNGAGKVTDTTSVSPTSPNNLSIGTRHFDNSNLMNGDIAHTAVWNIALSDADITTLAGGADPRSVQPANLVFYGPLGGSLSPEPDLISAANQTVTNGATKSSTDPTVNNIGFLPSVGASGTNSDHNAATTASIDTSSCGFATVEVQFQGASGSMVVSDSKGNSWSLAKHFDDGSNRSIEIWYSNLTSVGSGHTVTATISGGFPSVNWTAFLSAGGATLGNTNGATNASAGSLATGSVTPSADNAVIVAAGRVSGGGNTVNSINSSFQLPSTNGNDANNVSSGIAYFIQLTAAAKNPTFSFGFADTCVAAIAAFTIATPPPGNRFGDQSLPIRSKFNVNRTSFVQGTNLALLIPLIPPPEATFHRHWPNPVLRRDSDYRKYQINQSPNLALFTPQDSGVPTVVIAGVDQTANILYDSITIRDVNNQPATCSFVTINNYRPTNGQFFYIARGTYVLIAGYIVSSQQTYTQLTTDLRWNISAIDRTYLLRRRVPIISYDTISATTVIKDLISRYAPEFGTVGVQTGLPTISITFNGTQDLAQAILSVCNLIGASFSTGDGGDLTVTTTSGTTAARSITDNDSSGALNDSPLQVLNDLNQVRTRVYVRGFGSTLINDILAGETILPLVNSSMYSSSGGQAFLNPSTIITYTGVQAGGAGTLVDPGVTPSSAPAAQVAAGAGVDSGVHLYAVVYRTTNDTTLSLPGPTVSVTTGHFAAPSSAPVAGTPTMGSGPDPGSHQYKITFQDGTGETTPGGTVSVTTAQISAPGSAPTAANVNDGIGHGATGYAIGDNVQFAFSYSTDPTGGWNNNTALSSASGAVTLIQAPGHPAGFFENVNVTVPFSTDPNVKYIHIWMSHNGGTYQLFATGIIPNSGSGSYNTYVFGGTVDFVVYPGANPYICVVPLSSIPVGPTGITKRSIYRTKVGGTTFFKVADINDNSTTTFSDTVTDASLGSAAPSSNTTTANQVSLSSIPLGPTGTTQRWLYRTVAGGSQLKKLTTIADNTTTVYTDSTADASLGANVPSADTSGLTQQNGTVITGSITLITAGAGAFDPAGGWAVIGNGQQVIRYTGISGNTLIGIPGSGTGSISATISYGSTITAAPAITGCTNVPLAVKSTQLRLWAQRDNTTAQAALALIESGDGIHEHTLDDPSLINVAMVNAAGDAELSIFSSQLVTVSYATRDLTTHPGKSISIVRTSPPISAQLIIQDVTVTELWNPLGPRFTCTASTTKFTLQDLLAQIASMGSMSAAI
jgi:hypothetical protein